MSLSHVQLFATQWTVAYNAPPSMGFSRQETGVGCHILLQGIFLTQGLNLNLLHCRRILYHCSIVRQYCEEFGTEVGRSLWWA